MQQDQGVCSGTISQGNHEEGPYSEGERRVGPILRPQLNVWAPNQLQTACLFLKQQENIGNELFVDDCLREIVMKQI